MIGFLADGGVCQPNSAAITFQVAKQVVVIVCAGRSRDVIADVMAGQLWREQRQR